MTAHYFVDQKANQARLITLLNDLAPPMEIMAMSLTEVKDELREIKSGMNYHCNLCASLLS